MTEALLLFRESLGNIFLPYFGLLKFLSGLISLLLFTGIVYIILKLNVFGTKIAQFSDLANNLAFTKRRTIRAWLQIQERLKAGGESNLKMAVIEGDKILDEILKKSGFVGETMADRLKTMTSAQLSNIQQVWEAHKLRNQIVHQPDFEVSRAEAELAISIYGHAFQEMGLID